MDGEEVCVQGCICFLLPFQFFDGYCSCIFTIFSCILTLCFSKNVLLNLGYPICQHIIVHYILCFYTICYILQIFTFFLFNLHIMCLLFSHMFICYISFFKEQTLKIILLSCSPQFLASSLLFHFFLFLEMCLFLFFQLIELLLVYLQPHLFSDNYTQSYTLPSCYSLGAHHTF